MHLHFRECLKNVGNHIFGLDDDGSDSDDNILDFDGVFTMILKNHLKAACIKLEVQENVDISVQAEFASRVGLDVAAGINILSPTAIVQSLSWTLNLDSLSSAHNVDFDKVKQGKFKDLLKNWPANSGTNPKLTKDSVYEGIRQNGFGRENGMWKWMPKTLNKDGSVNMESGVQAPEWLTNSATPLTSKGFGIFPWSITPLSIGIVLGLSAEAALRLPGISVQIPKGGFWKLDILAQDHLQSNVSANITILEPEFYFSNPELHFNIMAGPKASFTLAHSLMKALPDKLNPTLSLSIRADLWRFDTSLFETDKAVDGHCKPVHSIEQPKPEGGGSSTKTSTGPVSARKRRPCPTDPYAPRITVFKCFDDAGILFATVSSNGLCPSSCVLNGAVLTTLTTGECPWSELLTSLTAIPTGVASGPADGTVSFCLNPTDSRIMATVTGGMAGCPRECAVAGVTRTIAHGDPCPWKGASTQSTPIDPDAELECLDDYGKVTKIVAETDGCPVDCIVNGKTVAVVDNDKTPRPWSTQYEVETQSPRYNSRSGCCTQAAYDAD